MHRCTRILYTRGGTAGGLSSGELIDNPNTDTPPIGRTARTTSGLPRTERSIFRTLRVPPYLPCLAGRNRSTRGRSAETHATRAHLHHNGPVWKCLGLGKTQSQSANRATPVEKVCHSAGLHSI